MHRLLITVGILAVIAFVILKSIQITIQSFSSPKSTATSSTISKFNLAKIPTATEQPTSTPVATVRPTPTPITIKSPTPNITEKNTKKVFLLIFNPTIESSNNQKLNSVLNWNNPDNLTSTYINDLNESSHGFINYQIAQRQEVDDFPILADGFDYNDSTFMTCWSDHTKCHEPSGVNYQNILTTYQACEKLNSGEIDELWLFGGPWFGFWEANMTGPNAYSTNGPVIAGTTCNKKLHIMGFNYERGVAEMLEDFGHRTEGTMKYTFGSWNHSIASNDWEKFTLIDKYSSGNSTCGFVHFAPNSDSDYDWSNTKYVASNCDGWLNYPNITNNQKQINCSEWSCDARRHLKWWFSHIPHATGSTNGKYNNWWKYIVDTNNI